MENNDITLLVFSPILLLCTLEILFKSVYSLVKKKAVYLIYEEILATISGILFGKKFYDRMNEKNLGGNKWKTRGIWGLLGGFWCLYMSLTMLFAALR